MFLQRQISVSLVEGQKDSLADGHKYPYKLVDVLPKYVLRLDNGSVSSGYLELDDGDSSSLQLPQAYVSTERLSCIIRSTLPTKLVVVSPDHGSSTFLLKSTDSEDEGEHFGSIMWQGTVTSITASLPAGSDPCEIEYFFFILPDLDSPTSYQMGETALGFLTNDF